MNFLIVFNHPFKGSYCNAVLQAVKEGLEVSKHSIDIIHLDEEQFNPVMSAEDLKAFRDRKPIDPQVIAYKERLEKADHLVFIFPIWWELMPALMKGFMDKVIFPGLAYDYTNEKHTRMKPLLNTIKGITVITTMNTPRYIYRWIFGNAIQKALLRGVFWKLGYKNRKWINFSSVKTVSAKQREKWLEEIKVKFSKL